jgi:hypothetical protein
LEWADALIGAGILAQQAGETDRSRSLLGLALKIYEILDIPADQAEALDDLRLSPLKIADQPRVAAASRPPFRAYQPNFHPSPVHPAHRVPVKNRICFQFDAAPEAAPSPYLNRFGSYNLDMERHPPEPITPPELTTKSVRPRS